MQWYKFDRANIWPIKRMVEQLADMAEKADFDIDTPDELTQAVTQSVSDINEVMFGENIDADYSFNKWKDAIDKTLTNVSCTSNQLDTSFALFMGYLSLYDEEMLYEKMKKNLLNMRNQAPNVFDYYVKTYTIFDNFWGALNPDEGVFDVVRNRAEALTKQRNEFIWLYGELGDYRSKHILYSVLKNWYSFDIKYLAEIKELNYDDYFDFDLIPGIDADEVFVDMGAYTGDTLKKFIENYGRGFKKYICYEAVPEHCRQILQENAGLDNLIIRNKAVGDKQGILNFDLIGEMVVENQGGKIGLEMVSLDEDIDIPVTWIKMDIEGSEQLAVKGSKRHICEEKPKLTICTYHNNEDIWKIARMVKEMRPDYKLYMRYNANTFHPSEYVLFAL